MLANELGQRLPAEFIAQLPGGLSAAYSSIPFIAQLWVFSEAICSPDVFTNPSSQSPEPLRTEVRKAFSESIRVIWIVLIPIVSGLASCQKKWNLVTDLHYRAESV